MYYYCIFKRCEDEYKKRSIGVEDAKRPIISMNRFRLIDTNADLFINATEALNYLYNIDPKKGRTISKPEYSLDNLEKWFHPMDKNKDGRISPNEFDFSLN